MKNLILQQIKSLKQFKNNQSQPTNTTVITQKIKEESIHQDTNLKSITSSNTNSQQSQSQPSKGRDLFQGLSFCFPFVDIDLSPRRI